MKAPTGGASRSICRKFTPSIQRSSSSAAAMKVMIPGALRSYTERGEVDVGGATLAAALAELDRQYTGIRFRIVDEQDQIRRHIRIFINGEQTHDLSQALAAKDEIVIVQALSGG